MGTAGETPNVSIEDALDEVANDIKLGMEQFRASYQDEVPAQPRHAAPAPSPSDRAGA